MYTRELGHSTLHTIVLTVFGFYVLFVYRDALQTHICIFEYWGPDLPHLYLWSWRSAFWNSQKAGFHGKGGKQVSQTSEGLAASISTSVRHESSFPLTASPRTASVIGFSPQPTSLKWFLPPSLRLTSPPITRRVAKPILLFCIHH